MIVRCRPVPCHHSPMPVRLLAPPDAPAFQRLRLAGLRDCPSAFGASYDEERGIPAATVAERLAPKPDRGVFGAFEDEELVGMAGLGREDMTKLAHKAFVWGVYVDPAARGKGISRALLQAAVAFAAAVPGLRQVNLSVNAGNTAAVRLYESLGFTQIGLEPCSLYVDGTFHDELQMALRLRDGPASACSR